MKKLNLTILTTGTLALAALGQTACSPVVAQRGNMLENYQLEQVNVGQSTQSDVLRVLGSPTTKAPFDDTTWYYIGQETEKRGILDAETVKERVIMATFDESGTLSYIGDVKDREDINVQYARDKTPTYGNDMTAIQQILGNLGKFNPQDVQ